MDIFPKPKPPYHPLPHTIPIDQPRSTADADGEIELACNRLAGALVGMERIIGDEGQTDEEEAILQLIQVAKDTVYEIGYWLHADLGNDESATPQSAPDTAEEDGDNVEGE